MITALINKTKGDVMDFTDKEKAIAYAIAVNEQQAYPVLVQTTNVYVNKGDGLIL